MVRDLVGYGNSDQKVIWPESGLVAINFVINYEEGSEQNILDGDSHSESYLTELPNVAPLEGKRNFSAESIFEYGSRAGIWRLLNIFDDAQIPVTLFATGLALARNPILAEYIKNSPHEIAGHGYRWINYRQIGVNQEKDEIYKTIKIIEQSTNKKVSGWYTGRASENTRRLIIEAGLKYDSDSYSDDLPYWIGTHLIIPYSLDTNDILYLSRWGNSHDCFTYLKDTFDTLYEEGQTKPKMMSVGLHPRISGHPGRSKAIKEFLHYIMKKRVWICRREEIANYWYQRN